MPLLLLPLLLGCARVTKFLTPEDFLTESAPYGEVADVRWATGWRDEPHRNWPPEGRQVDGRWMRPPAAITSSGWIEVDPNVEDVEVSLWVRHTGLNTSAFQPVRSVSGAIPRNVRSEVRFLPRRLDEAWRMPMHQLHNVYNDYRLEDGDLLLVEVSAPGIEPERYLFRSEEFGLRTRFGAGVLVRIPLREGGDVSPALALTLSGGFKPRSRDRFLTWLGTRVSLLGSLGMGSTALDQATGIPDEDNLRTFFNAALAGGGIELYDFVSFQILANLSSLTRNEAESASTVAIGFDAVQFGRFTEDAVSRLFRKNHLDDE